MGSLAPHRKTPPVAKSAIGANIHKALDIHRHFFSEITLDSTFGIDHLADLADLLLG